MRRSRLKTDAIPFGPAQEEARPLYPGPGELLRPLTIGNLAWLVSSAGPPWPQPASPDITVVFAIIVSIYVVSYDGDRSTQSLLRYVCVCVSGLLLL